MFATPGAGPGEHEWGFPWWLAIVVIVAQPKIQTKFKKRDAILLYCYI